MKLKLDENLPIELLTDLRAAGHHAETVPEEGLTGSADHFVMQRVQSEGAVLLTMDKGIANTHAYPPKRYAGIVLFRPRSSGRGAVLTFIRRHLPAILQAELPGHLFVISDRGIRIR
jgi:predicted nuclease of predicted toxin-antitoxin system